MKNSIVQFVSDVSQSPKVAAVVSGATTSSGIATVLNWIPSDVGKLATAIGIVLSITLIATHVVKFIRDSEKHKIEMLLLNRDLKRMDDPKQT